MADTVKKVKISALSKDFNVESKRMVEELKNINIEGKNSGASVTVDEFEVFMDYITKAHEVKDASSFDSYSKGKMALENLDEKKKKVDTKPSSRNKGSGSIGTENSKPKTDPKGSEKVTPGEETKPAPKEETKVAPKEEAKVAQKEDGRRETNDNKKPESRTEKSNQRNDGRQNGNRQDGYQGNGERRQGNYQNNGDRRQGSYQNNGDRRQENFQNGGDRRQNSQNRQGNNPRSFENRQNGNRQGGFVGNGANRQGTQGNRPNGRYNQAPSDDPFAKRRESMQRNAEGGMRGNRRDVRNNGHENTENSAPQRPLAVEEATRVSSALRPAQQAQLEKKQKLTETSAKKATPKKEEKKSPAQKQQLKTITPNVDRSNIKGGVNINTEYVATTAPGKRVVDMRTSDVDLSKYDDHFNDQYYSILNGTDNKSSKTKLKKQDNRGQNAKSAKDKERAAQEKIKRMEAERARNKQLEITVPDEITLGELATRLKKTSAEVIKKLMMMGEMKTVNDVVDYDTAELIATEFGAKVTKEVVVTIEERLFDEAEDSEEDLETRAPVVCVMGHVDHGKTSILDAIRHTSVTRGEAGGITQAIGAYRVKVDGQDITFLDTPGHEAFTAMRMRGAKSTDIAILVVAADDGVMPQTVEAINHAKAAGIDIIVAINKMDKPTANPDNILNQLTQHELVPEAWGGDVITVPVSAHTGMGIKDLLESVLLVAEVKELKANPNRRAKGLVIESKLDKGRGPVATVLVQNGTLHQGDYVIVGTSTGRVRAMVDDKGKHVKKAGPSVPVEIIGLDDVPQAGDELNAVEDERMARSLAEDRKEKQRQEILQANARVNLDELFSRISDGIKYLNIIVKADVDGSAEAVKASLLKLTNDEVKVNVIHSAVGGITESDVMLAAASDAIIVGFNVRPDKNALDSAERNKVDIRCHRIIYEIIDEVESAMKGMLAPTFKEVLLGHAEVRQTIRVPNVGIIAGCYVQDGKITRQSQIRIVRDGIVIFEDKISSLRRFKDDVKEVNEGYECGVGIEKFNDIREGDTLEAFIMEEVKRD